MKIPFVRIARPHRFNITPRHYDPVKEEIEIRTAAIKKQLEAKGLLPTDLENVDQDQHHYGSSIKGSFRTRRGAKSTPLLFEKTGLLRLFIFALLVGGLGGYLYLGSDIVYYLFYLFLGIGLIVGIRIIKGRQKNE
jgi:hypothetical protein